MSSPDNPVPASDTITLDSGIAVCQEPSEHSLTNSPVNLPRQRLAFKFTRRQFFASLVTTLQVADQRSQGGRVYDLSTLGDLPDRDLALLIPVIVSGCEISVVDGYVWGRPPADRQAVRLFPTEPLLLAVFNRFNGLTPLGTIGCQLAEEIGWDEVQGFTFARQMFLQLVLAKVCTPQ